MMRAISFVFMTFLCRFEALAAAEFDVVVSARASAAHHRAARTEQGLRVAAVDMAWYSAAMP
jgi:hypothetical protein